MRMAIAGVEEVAVSRCLGYHCAGGVDMRTRDGAVVDGWGYFECVRAEVADGGEAGTEDGGEGGDEASASQGRWGEGDGGQVEGFVADEVGVAVPEAGHEDWDGRGRG